MDQALDVKRFLKLGWEVTGVTHYIIAARIVINSWTQSNKSVMISTKIKSHTERGYITSAQSKGQTLAQRYTCIKPYMAYRFINTIHLAYPRGVNFPGSLI